MPIEPGLLVHATPELIFAKIKVECADIGEGARGARLCLHPRREAEQRNFTLSAETAAISALQGRLRSAHLAAHLETRDVLTPEQLAGNPRLRGDGNQTAEPHHHR
jgi:hypothetical protein